MGIFKYAFVKLVSVMLGCQYAYSSGTVLPPPQLFEFTMVTIGSTVRYSYMKIEVTTRYLSPFYRKRITGSTSQRLPSTNDLELNADDRGRGHRDLYEVWYIVDREM